MPPRKPTSKSRGSARKPARKSVRRPARKSVRKRAASGRGVPRRKARAKKHGFLFKLFFWPFLLLVYVTRNWSVVLKWPARVFGGMAILGLLGMMMVAGVYYLRAVPYDMKAVEEMPARTLVYARDGRTELGRLHGDNRYLVKYDEVSADFRKALVAREDRRFYSHWGIDLKGVARAMKENIRRKRLAQGASTLSIQLAENTWFPPDRGDQKSTIRLIDQKLLEMALAWRIERNYEKADILEHYMNRIFWGHSIRGVESASRTYFEKPASQISLGEAAMLAGIIRGPNAFSPFKNIKAATRERDNTINQLLRYGHITEAQATDAKSRPLQIRPINRRVVQSTYVMDAVRRELDRILEEENIQDGGLTVITTIDHTIQRSAQLSVERNILRVENTTGYRHQKRKQWQKLATAKKSEPRYLQGACVVIENGSGAVLCVVGGRNANESKFNRAVQAKRQIGSIFKPFVYMSAFDQGMMPKTWVPDGRIEPGEIRGAQRTWSPRNSDGKYGSYISAEDALVKSRNTSSVRVGNFAGIEAVNQTAMDVGFMQGVPKNPSSYLGSWEATPWQVASAYTVFPNNGDWYRPYIIQEIRNAKGERVFPGKGDSGKLVVVAADSGATWSVSNILKQVIDRGTGRRVRALGFRAPCAGKTGTTDDYKDAWFAGYTGSVTCAVWVGLDTPKKIINRGYGSTLAAPIWVDVMKTAGRLGYATPEFESVRLEKASLCRWSAKRATEGCKVHHSAYVAEVPADMLPGERDFCTVHPLRALPPQRRGFRRQPPRAVPVNPARPPRAVPVDE